MCSFLWLVVKGALLTNVKRVRRHLAPYASDLVCGVNEETTTHVLVLMHRQGFFFSMGTNDWLGYNLSRGMGRYSTKEWANILLSRFPHYGFTGTSLFFKGRP